jgi:hypothetical protein
MSLRQRLINAGIALAVCAVLIGFVYPLLQESGHTLAALACGGSASGMDLAPFSAHVHLSGSFTSAQMMLINIAGLALPFFVWALFLVLVRKDAPPIVELVKLFSSAIVIGTLLPWLVIPFLVTSGRAPSGEDATKVIVASGLPHWLFAMMATGLIAGAVILYIKKKSGLRRLFDQPFV